MKRLLLLMLVILSLAACAKDEAKSDPITPAKDYLNARVGADEDKLRALSCLDHQEAAATSAASFASVKAEARDVACTQGEAADNLTPVTCTGTYFYDYDGESQERAFEVTLSMRQQDGEWKVCSES